MWLTILLNGLAKRLHLIACILLGGGKVGGCGLPDHVDSIRINSVVPGNQCKTDLNETVICLNMFPQPFHVIISVYHV